MDPGSMPTDEWLLSLLRNGEDHIAERKSGSDKDGWVKTVVAFANSVPIGSPAVLFIGVDSKGNMVEPNTGDAWDAFQRDKLFPELDRIYPPVYRIPRTLTDEGGRKCVAVIVPVSPDRPHFAGHSFVRNGSRTDRADELQFQALIAQRSSKVYEIRKWLGQEIICWSVIHVANGGDRIEHRVPMIVKDCNTHYVTLQKAHGGLTSPPLSMVELSLDDEKGVLRLFIRGAYVNMA